MKTVVVYASQTGFTLRYAQWIAEAVQADCLPLSDAKRRDLDGYDAIVFGGWACAGKIRGVAWFRRNLPRWSGKVLAAFCVGGSPLENPDVETALRQNFTEAERKAVSVFYCPGGFCYEKMSAPSRLAMKLFLRALQKKPDKTETERQMLQMISTSYDISDKKYIEPIVALLRR